MKRAFPSLFLLIFVLLVGLDQAVKFWSRARAESIAASGLGRRIPTSFAQDRPAGEPRLIHRSDLAAFSPESGSTFQGRSSAEPKLRFATQNGFGLGRVFVIGCFGRMQMESAQYLQRRPRSLSRAQNHTPRARANTWIDRQYLYPAQTPFKRLQNFP